MAGVLESHVDQPLGLKSVNKMKILGVVFGMVSVEKDNWEPRLSKLDSCLSLWKSRSLSFVGKVLILNVLGLSKLLYLSRVLIPRVGCLTSIIAQSGPFMGCQIRACCSKVNHVLSGLGGPWSN